MNIKRLFTLMLCIFLLSSLTSAYIFAEGDISVIIDGDKLSFDVPPQIINGRTMVPLRAIFEYFGSDVEWNSYSKSITSKAGNISIYMQVNNTTATVNSVKTTLDSPPVIIDGRTMVPLRFIAEAFSADVKWNGDTRTATITTPYPKNLRKPASAFDEHRIVTSESDFEKTVFEINGNKLTITAEFNDKSKESILIKVGEIKEYTDADSKGRFKVTLNLDKVKINDFEFLSLYTKAPDEDMYYSYTFDCLKIIKEGKSYRFEKPMVLDNNLSYSEKWITPLAYTGYDIDERIQNVSDEICRGITSDYEKLKALHTWICENVYYDYDYYLGNSDILYYCDTEVLESKRTVCGGYTNLLLSLIRAQGIPARAVTGYALGLSSKLRYWTEESAATESSNHAWIQAYADNRWINIDSTWDSGNKYKNGKFNYEGLENYLHFDISETFIALDHKVLKTE